jgi:hypothetical protein
LITLTILGEEYKPCSSSCSFLQPPVTSSILGPNNIYPPRVLNGLIGSQSYVQVAKTGVLFWFCWTPHSNSLLHVMFIGH